MTARILVVDDEPDSEALVRQRFRREVRERRYALAFASPGGAMLAALAGGAGGPDLLLLSDINGQGISWLALLRQVRTQRPDLPVIVLIADDDPTTVRLAKEAGADAVYAKPVDFDALRAEIDRCLASRGRGI